jgi:hypothetical protein
MEDGSSAVAVVLREVAHQAGTGLTDISETGGWRAYRARPEKFSAEKSGAEKSAQGS